MFLLQMNFQELERFETVLPDLITMLEIAREHYWGIRRRGFVTSVILDVMEVTNMLTKVILPLEAVVASISVRMSKLATKVV